MKPSPRFTLMFALLVVFGLTISGYGQGAAADPEAAAAISNGQAGFVGPVLPVDVRQTQPGQLTISSSTVFDAVTGAVVGAGGGQGSARTNTPAAQAGNDDSLVNGEVRHTPLGGTIDGLDTIATFDGAFAAGAGPSTGKLFRFSMIGNHPLAGDTTVIPAQIDEISLTLLNADGSVLTTVPFAPFEQATLESPNFEPLDYRSGRNIQYGDAIHRAQFFNRMDKDWHTVLVPHVVNKVSITVPRFVNVQLSNGTIIQARSYFIGTAADGSTFVLMLNLLFNFFFDNEVVNQINLGNFTTKSLNMTLFPNTYLFSLNVNNPNTPGGCCVLGFHTFFLDPSATPQPRWITQYASWISPGIFGGGFQDVTALSHETAEAFADPFIDNVTPSWQFPGEPPTAKVCQGNLEEGDPIEVLPNAVNPITVKEPHFSFTYHPQIIPLLQWFEMGATSNAIDGAFSFPDETALPHSALPCPQ
ncbi:MAG TPA: hypothetical protein VFT65_07325 [Candidatus Angelobacter sp.]|nr:hypothetical protein [Candidatus Angelobacter sp.]